MSVRAYKVIKIKHKKANTFNIWHDTGLVNFLQEGVGYGALNEDGCGLWDIPVDLLKRALTEVKHLAADVKVATEADITEAEAEQEDYITYYCY